MLLILEEILVISYQHKGQPHSQAAGGGVVMKSGTNNICSLPKMLFQNSSKEPNISYPDSTEF